MAVIIMIERMAERRYFEWSYIVDAPLTYGLTLDELHCYVRERYGTEGLEALPQRLERVHEYGSSMQERRTRTPEDLLAGNRAGKGETELTVDEFWTEYVTNRPDVAEPG